MKLRETAVVFTAVVCLAGCGVSASGLETMRSKASVPTTISSTSVPDRSTSTVAPDTTAAPDTSLAPGTTAAPDTSLAPDTTLDTGSGNWPTSAENQFLSSCEKGQATAPVCECTLRAVEPQVTVQQLAEAGSTGTLPPNIQDKIVQAASECAQDPGSH